jgi:hypothetical protein
MAKAGTKSWSGSFPFHGPRQAQPPLSSAGNIARPRARSNETRSKSPGSVREARHRAGSDAGGRTDRPGARRVMPGQKARRPGRRTGAACDISRNSWTPLAADRSDG